MAFVADVAEPWDTGRDTAGEDRGTVDKGVACGSSGAGLGKATRTVEILWPSLHVANILISVSCERSHRTQGSV